MSGADPAAPTLPAGYEYVRPLGSGGFGEVVLARQTSLGRLVAIKRIHEWVADADNVARFRREATVLASTSCESVVQVFDLTVADGTAFLVMEYVPGGSLLDLLGSGPRDFPAAVRILRDVAHALETMAAQGLVHRDVKPANVFILPNGRAKLGDFGLARPLDDPLGFRTAGPPTGTPAYFPPEVSRGLAEPDARSDAYSFSVMAYEMLVGRRPYDAPDAVSMIVAHWDSEPPVPSRLAPDLPGQVDRALLRGLAKDPAQRLLPMALVDELEVVAGSVRRAQVTPPPAQRNDVTTVRAEVPAPASAYVPPARPAPGRAARFRRWRGLVGPALAVLAVLVLGILWALREDGDGGGSPVEALRVDVSVDHEFGRCPRADFRFTGVVHTNGGSGRLTVQWTRPDGEAAGERTFDLSESQRELTVELDFSVSGRRPLRGAAELRVLEEGGPRDAAAIRYTCPP